MAAMDVLWCARMSLTVFGCPFLATLAAKALQTPSA